MSSDAAPGPGVGAVRGPAGLVQCVVPVLEVTWAGADLKASVAAVTWQGLRCKVTVDGAAKGFKVDLRSQPNAPGTSLATTSKPLDAEGRATLLVEDDGLLGTAAYVVLLDAQGKPVDKWQTAVGGEA